MFKFIDKIGLEIEGGWSKSRSDLTPDGSVRLQDFDDSEVAMCGELISKPFASKELCEKFILSNWPTSTQPKCGFHIHFSLKDISYYVALMSPEFLNYFCDKMSEFGKSYPIQNEQFWDRLAGNNKFCRKAYEGEFQIRAKKKNDCNRYTILHYAYGIHKTIESRLLPTFVSAETALAAFNATISIVEEYLSKKEIKPFNFKIEDNVSNEDHTFEKRDEETITAEIPKQKPMTKFNFFEAKLGKNKSIPNRLKNKKNTYEGGNFVSVFTDSYNNGNETPKFSYKKVTAYEDYITTELTSTPSVIIY